jgi:hypothetical protein
VTPLRSVRQVGNPTLVDAAYLEANTPIVREQLHKAGVRLAHLLDSVLRK